LVSQLAFPGLVVVDSVTKLDPASRGSVIVGGSHGGVYAAWLAACGGARGVILNDAGIGKDQAGIAGLDFLAKIGCAAAAIGHDTARIGDGADMLARGIIRHVNPVAAAQGCAPGMTVRAAAEIMRERGVAPAGAVPAISEARHRIDGPWGDRAVVCALDSNSLVRPDDAGAIVVTGSHGALLGGKPESAIRVDAFAAIYNDAGGGIDDAGYSRLPALDARAIAGATVHAHSARIGDARSTYDDGIISKVNATAARYGGRVGMSCRDFVAAMARARTETQE
jgi:hypothetical protein